jgi:c-di-GMP-binding flagellar brake protein YcgR
MSPVNVLYHKNLAPIDVCSDGRRYKRFVREESVIMDFRDQKATGNLVNLSATGLFATFARGVSLPGVRERVSIHIDLDGQGNALDIDGVVVRLRHPRENEPNDHVGVAVDFSDTDQASKYRIGSIINFLIVKDNNYHS